MVKLGKKNITTLHSFQKKVAQKNLLLVSQSRFFSNDTIFSSQENCLEGMICFTFAI